MHARELGLRYLRYGPPIYRVFRGKDDYDWSFVDQVMHVRADSEHPVRGVVFMGMGEPFLNYERVMRAAAVMADPCGLGVAAKAITIFNWNRRCATDAERISCIVWNCGTGSSESSFRISARTAAVIALGSIAVRTTSDMSRWSRCQYGRYTVRVGAFCNPFDRISATTPTTSNIG